MNPDLDITLLYAQWEKVVQNTEISVNKTGNIYTISVMLQNGLFPSDLLICSYKKGELIHLERRKYTGGSETFTFTGDIGEVKVMVWDSTSPMKPLCKAEVIPSSEFIVK